jgi:hypothetical protein
MASTRNRNSAGDYAMETYAYSKRESFLTKHESVGEVYLPCNGLLGQKCPSSLLSNNYTDVESFLFGIGSTNLVAPKYDVKPDLIPKKFHSIANRPTLIMPEEFVLDKNQRPMFSR